MSVSYTHLDVYKRQIYICTFNAKGYGDRVGTGIVGVCYMYYVCVCV